MRIDLHLHSTASDGAYTPDEVVRLALKHQLDVIALTDHDTVSGIEPARKAAEGSALRVIAGVEMSAEDDRADRHILGYFVETGRPELRTFFEELQSQRLRRVQEMVERLSALGVPVDVAEVLRIARGGAVGRPHLARALLAAGRVISVQAAFDLYIGDGKPAYVPHHRVAPGEAIDFIHAVGGVAVLAHPGRYADPVGILDELIPLGLDGVEVYYPEHSPELIQRLEVIARQHHLAVTAGSDFHRREPDGSARIGSVRFPPTLKILDDLESRIRR